MPIYSYASPIMNLEIILRLYFDNDYSNTNSINLNDVCCPKLTFSYIHAHTLTHTYYYTYFCAFHFTCPNEGGRVKGTCRISIEGKFEESLGKKRDRGI